MAKLALMNIRPFSWVALAFILQHSVALPTSAWKRRAIYQVITDRFALEAGRSETCDIHHDKGETCKYGSYCGGSFQGIAEKLDYIQGMGFDAIWISPVAENTACGYHGYWTQNLLKINQNFGGERGLKKFVDAAHARGIAVMFDSVVNHVGPATVAAAAANDYSMYTPFNESKFFHGTYDDHGMAQAAPLKDGQHIRETGWMGILGELPDLAQEKPEVAKIVTDWVKGLRKEYSIDGFRMDALPYVNKSFYQLLKSDALAGVYTTGEVVIGGKDMDFSANYQFQQAEATGDNAADHVSGWVIDGIINYEMNDALQHVFQEIDPTAVPPTMSAYAPMPFHQPLSYYLEEYYKAKSHYKDVGALTNFVSVHDQPRWLYMSPDWRTYKNAFVTTFFMPGIPINYYGDEQGVRGGNTDDTCRSPLWQTGYDQNHPLYLFTKSVVTARKAMLASLTDEEIDDVKHLTGSAYAMTFQRGSAVVIVEKVLPSAVTQDTIIVATEYEKGTVLCDALLGSQYCALVGDGGTFTHNISGTSKVLFPSTSSATDASALAKAYAGTAWLVASVMVIGLICASGIVRQCTLKPDSADSEKAPYLALA